MLPLFLFIILCNSFLGFELSDQKSALVRLYNWVGCPHCVVGDPFEVVYLAFPGHGCVSEY